MSTADPFSDFLYPFNAGQQARSLEVVLAEVQGSTLQKARDIASLRQAVANSQLLLLASAARALAEAFARGGQLLAFGNGGSATDAQDLAADCLHPAAGRQPFPALSLTNDIGVVTAVGNDVGFENVFARQIIAFGRPGDVAVGFSTSGQSPNVLAAFRQAQKQNLLTLGFTGNDGGSMAHAGLDFCFVVPSSYVPRIQEAHATLYHSLLDLSRYLWETHDEVR